MTHAVRRAMTLAACLLGFASVAPAYYHWTYFAGRSAPFLPIHLKFDLTTLPDQTVQFFVANSGPTKMVDGDNFTSLVSQIKRAGETWNLSSSAIHLRFGGLENPQSVNDTLASEVTPGIDVVFDDELTPGVLALTEPVTNSDLHYLGAANSPGFAPILRSRLRLHSDLTANAQASWSDDFFTTLVHEFGHTLGLQHSLTSAAMATSITRSTNKATPLTTDDIAGVSVLYPVTSYLAATGSITGHVNVAGFGANLASVVAISIGGSTATSASGAVVGGMSLPDGSYRIDALAPGDYLVYAHPLPPAQLGEAGPAGIIPPKDLDGTAFLGTAAFETRFYPYTKDWTQAVHVTVVAGKSTDSIDFNVLKVTSQGVYDLRMFADLGTDPKNPLYVHAPPLPVGFRNWLVFQAPGLMVTGSTKLAAGLKLSPIGDGARLEQNTLQNFPGSADFLLIVADADKANGATPIAVTVTTDSDLYVLPAAFSTVPTQQPRVASMTPSVDDQNRQYATLTGSNLDGSTMVLFDGTAALAVQVNGDGSLTAAAPPSAGDHLASLEVVSPSGQTSGQVQDPPQFLYAAPPDPSLLLNPATLAAGMEAEIEVSGTQTDFLDGQTVLAFGTSDILVRRMWVVNRGYMLVDVAVNPLATPGNYPVTAATGVQFATLGTSLQILPADPKQISLHYPVLNDATGLGGVPVGGTLTVLATGLPDNLAGWNLVIGGLPLPIVRGADGWLRAVIPAGVSIGPRPIQLTGPGGVTVPPLVMQVDGPPPIIVSVSGPGGKAVSTAQKLQTGDRVSMVAVGLADESGVVDQSSVQIRVGGVVVPVDVISPLAQLGYMSVQFLVPANAPSGDAQTVTVGVGTRVSPPATLAIAANAATSDSTDPGQ